MDVNFYQMCGHAGCSPETVIGKRGKNSELLCSSYVCEMNNFIFGGVGMDAYYQCNNWDDCRNTNFDEAAGICSFEESFQCTHSGNSRIDASKVCDLHCDCWSCEDEGSCKNVTYGIYCEVDGGGEYVPPVDVCDNAEEHCADGEDEIDCTADVVRNCRLYESNEWYPYFEDGIRPISQHQVCAVPRGEGVCSDGLDQVNCTDLSRVALTCSVHSFQTTISRFAICKDHFLCDDGYDSNCVQPEGGCIIHKNQLCDGIDDCSGQQDENHSICQSLTNVTCTRRVSLTQKSALQIPFDWVFDGVPDCIDGRDEDESYWKICGVGNTARFVEKGTACKDVLRCSNEAEGLFEIPEIICDKINTCGREIEICEKSRGMRKTFDVVLEVEKLSASNRKGLIFCLKGMEGLIQTAGGCRYKHLFTKPGESAEYATKSYLNLPNTTVDCHGMFGENYVYMACTESCSAASCPLQPVPQDTCANKPQQKVYAHTQSNKLQVLLPQQNGYTNELFPCENKNCVPYNKVCNLVDDCGDGSDEINCTNHFYCNTSNEFIPASSKCDGFYDCRYFDDECREECDASSRQILSSTQLKVCSFVIGSLAIVFNGFAAFTSISDLRKLSTYEGTMNRVLVFLINLGDFLMGCYLISIAIVDLKFSRSGHEYCKEKFSWLASTECAVLGIINTIASQISLFAMTALSVFRICAIGSMVQSGIDNMKPKLKIIGVVALISVASLILAGIPMTKTSEDFFVNGFYYKDNPLFTASVSKHTHQEVFSEHYGRSRNTGDYSWQMIRRLVRGMFTDDYGGKKTLELDI